jgi:uncharacterized protein (TIGR02466 family)
LDNYKIEGLFPLPMYTSTIKVDDKVKEFLLSQEFRKIKSGIGSFSKNTYLLNLPECAELKQEIMLHLNRFTNDTLKVIQHEGFYMTNSWIVKTEPGEWIRQHNHAYALLSAVMYLQTDDNCGDIIFYRDNATPVFSHTILPEFSQRNIYNCDNIQIEPKVGSIMIWPSCIYHEVLKNTSNTTRYSLAFNFFIKGSFGADEHELVL